MEGGGRQKEQARWAGTKRRDQLLKSKPTNAGVPTAHLQARTPGASTLQGPVSPPLVIQECLVLCFSL